MLQLNNVFAGYGGGDVLQGVNLEIEKGSLTCIVGPNGAGKSTVLRSISGLLKPRRGTITFQGQSIGGLSAPHILKLGIAHIPQEHSLFSDMTIRENMEVGGLLLRDHRRIERRLHEIQEQFPIVKERGGLEMALLFFVCLIQNGVEFRDLTVSYSCPPSKKLKLCFSRLRNLHSNLMAV